MRREIETTKVVCIDNSSGNARHLDLYEVYDVKNSPEDEYYIIETYPYEIPIHNGKRLKKKSEIWVIRNCFLTIQEWRQKRIEQIDLDHTKNGDELLK